jgi:asparagine synthase (glutamine-hydrolysing)
MWILSRYISQNTPFKVILSGEGSDELFAGYKYFQNSPSVEDMFSEIRRRVMLLHQFDVLRADRCTAAHGLELRVPFLDKEFVKAAMTMDQSLKLPTGELIEKCVLRSEFQGKVPYNILWRPKDAFSDAVGYSWIDEVKAYAESQVSDEEFDDIKRKAKNHNVPLTKEEALYRKIFWEFFGYVNDTVITEIWRPLWTNVTEPSARYIT